MDSARRAEQFADELPGPHARELRAFLAVHPRDRRAFHGDRRKHSFPGYDTTIMAAATDARCMLSTMAYRLLSTSILVSMFVVAAPSRAEACSFIECERLVGVELAQPGPIPAGETALVLQPVQPEDTPVLFNAEGSAAAVAVTVTPKLGGPAVPGEVVAIAELDLLVWRPSMPLAPDTEFEVAVTVDNTMLEYTECAPDGFETTLSVTTGPAMAVPLTLSDLTAEAEVESEPFLSPDTLVCCDGAIPIDESGGCGDPVAWFEGTCAAGSAFARLAVTARIDPTTLAATMGQVGYHFAGVPFAPGTSVLELRRDKPFCGELTAIHLMTGETMTGPEVCVGQDLADMLGLIPLDPAPGLTMCVGQPYTCALANGPNGELWDSEDCMPWPEGQETDGDPTTGDTPTTDGPPTTGDEPTSGDATGPGESSGETSVGGTGDEGGERGCACNSTDAGAPWLALLLAWPRRRRAGLRA
jgi:hypothetical protein